MSHPSDPLDLAELQLERELRQMFELDSQKDLETYLACVDNLEDESWAADIQKMYRAVHTIKGGSVTVKADAILDVATVLEDLLSELRYLETIPSLEDGQLRQILQEGGEIIASVLGNQEGDVRSKVERIKVLQQHIQQSYLQDWNEQAQVQIEFAEEGFDLVVLDLDIALNKLSEEVVPQATIELATQLIEELAEIGRELELDSGWQTLLQEAALLLNEPDASLWTTRWHDYFCRLKASAKQGGKFIDSDTTEENTAEVADLGDIDSLLDNLESEEPEAELELSPPKTSSSGDALDLGDIDSLLDNLESEEPEPELELSQPKTSSSGDALDLGGIDSLLDNLESEESEAQPDPPKPISKPIKSAKPSRSPATVDTQSDRNIQIPIPLRRLDKSAQSIVDTLISARTVEHFYQDLHQDLLKLVNLAKDNVQYITQLRQIQDDYALLENLDRKALQNSQSPTPERYRKGYITINRLLENSLRLSELGTEAEQTAKKTAARLEKLNSHVTELKDVVEDSRLVPFKNLSFRVRAILRDLINRYDKPVELKVQGEQIELDVGTSKRLEPILLHIVRNAFDHGLETTAERISQGKPVRGILSLNLQRHGSSYVLTIQDDGKGIDPQKVRAKAQQLKFPLTRTDTDEELLSVICQPGFSSRNEVSEVSGRGVGMDVVAEQISLLNGSLSLSTNPGTGTTFSIHFPVPHLLVPCILLQAGDRSFAIPTDRVIMTSLWENLAAVRTEGSQVRYTWEITQDGSTLPGLDLLGYWYPRFRDRSLNPGNIGIYVRLQPEQPGIWLLADKLLGKLELKIQPIPTPLVAPQGIMGVSLQADSTLMPILELSSLMEYLVPTPESPGFSIAGDRESDTVNFSAAEEQSQTILIVDDAALIRRRIEASLSAYGYTTHACSDGLEAWNWLQINPHPNLMITDIEMPNLDGFTLIDRCRQNNWNFPIIVVSSRLAEEWGQEARRLGGTDFLTKGFSTGELIGKVQQYFS
ncbi:response regulator [Pleurocapsales cyanobacterium LEGE 10410]|nr:response regulator [Pleurocapsales cyanobacterium LEGE 10410]